MINALNNFANNGKIWVPGSNYLRYALQSIDSEGRPRKDDMDLKSAQGSALGSYPLSFSWKKPEKAGFFVKITDIQEFCRSMLIDLKSTALTHAVSWMPDEELRCFLNHSLPALDLCAEQTLQLNRLLC